MSTRVLLELTATYRAAGQTEENGGNTWEGRLLNALDIEAKGKISAADPQALSQYNLTLANLKGGTAWINLTTETLWKKKVTIAIDGVTNDWVGEIRNYSIDGNGILTIVVAEPQISVLKLLIPDEVVRLGDYPEASRGSDMTPGTDTVIPTIFGGVSADPVRTRAILVDKVNFCYLICVGEIREVVGVLKDRIALLAGSPAVWTSYLGAAGQATYPGHAYLQFAADPRDDAGRWPEVLVDVVGNILSTSPTYTEAECRNPARVAYCLLTTARSGACGWGLGVDAGDVDATSFNQAIADCDTFGFLLDGAMFAQAEFSVWKAEIERTCRGRIYFEAGKWKMSIDQTSASVAAFDETNMEPLYYGKGDMQNRKNRVVLDFRYDITDGRMLSAQTRDDGASQTIIDVNETRLTGQLIRNQTSAGKIADYHNKFQTYSETRLEFRTRVFSALAEGSVFTASYTGLGWSIPVSPVQKFRVVKIRYEKDAFTAVVEARSYSDLIFGNEAPSTTVDPSTDPYLPGPDSVAVPGVPSGLSLSTGITAQADGSFTAWVQGTYTPGARTLFTSIEYSISSPLSWSNLQHDQTGIFRIIGLPVGTSYTFRLTSHNTGGDSAPITDTIVTAADTTAPLKPQTPTLSLLFKSIRVRCWQNAVKAADLAGFKVFRHTSNDSASATEIGFAPCAGNEDGVVFLDETTGYGTTYYYWSKAVDSSGNASAFSDPAGPMVTTAIVAGDVATGAINASAIFACGVIDAAAIAACAVTSLKTCLAGIDRCTGHIAAGAICNANQFGTGVVDATAIANCAVTAVKTCLASIDRCTGCLVANIVGACQVIAGAICTCHIVAGAIIACLLAAGSVTSSKILVVSPGAALNRDPNTSDNSAWDAGFTHWICTVADGQVGNTVLRACCASVYDSLPIPITCQKQYRLTALMRSSAAANGNNYFRFYQYDASCCLLAYDLGFECVAPTTCWTRLTAVVTPPATAIWGCLNVFFNWLSTCGYTEVQDVRVEEVLPGTLIKDGVITTSKIAANAIIACLICANAVTSGAICAGAVGANAIAAANIMACHLCAATITGDRIAANTLTASNLAVYGFGENLINNGDFEDGVCGWEVIYGTATLASSSAEKVSGNSSLLVCNASGDPMIGNYAVPVIPGETYFIRAKAKGSCAVGTAYFYLEYCTTKPARAVCHPGSCNDYIAGCAVTTSWQDVCGTFVVPGGQYWLTSSLYSSGLGGKCIFWDEVQLKRVTVSAMIADGSITTPKIVANAITSGLICAGAITSAHICTSGLCADCITSGTICADRIIALNGSSTLAGECIGCMFEASGANLISDSDMRSINLAGGGGGMTVGYTYGEWYFGGDGGAIGQYFLKEDAVTTAKAGSNTVRLINKCDHYSLLQGPYTCVKGGRCYNYSVYVAHHPGQQDPSAYVGLLCYGLDGTYLSTSWPLLEAVRITNDLATRCSVNICLPATVGFVRPVVYNYNNNWSGASYAYLYVSGFQLTELCGLKAWKVGDQGTITANMVRSGALSSLNYSTSAGSCIDMNGGTFAFGGSSAPALCWNGSTLAVRGTVCSSCFVATDSGANPVTRVNICYSGAGQSSTSLVSLYSCDYIPLNVRTQRTTAIYASAPSVAIWGCASGNGAIYGGASCCGVVGHADKYQGVYGSACEDGVLGCASSQHGVSGNGPHYDTTSSRQYKVPTCRNLAVLASLRGLPLQQWKYHDRNQRGLDEFIGPYEDDWRAAFGLHFSGGMYESNVAGVALRGVQELDLFREAQSCCICEQAACICNMENRLANLENLMRRCA